MWRFKNGLEFIDFYNSVNTVAKSVVPGFNICLTFGGTITENKMTVTQPDIVGQLQLILEEMAEFYKKERIEQYTGFYKKYRVGK